MNNSTKKWVAVVLGMHRSGTSVITRALQAAGVDLGNALVEAGEDNPRGFWEDAGVREINEELLKAFGLDWYSVPKVDAALLSGRLVQPLTERAVSLLQKRLSNSMTWAFKDPRTARLLPFWKSVFTMVDVEPRWILALRHPGAVALSLADRNGFTLEQGLLLWLMHMVDVLDNVGDQAVLVIDFDTLIREPNETVGEMADFLNLGRDIAFQERLAEFREVFLDPKLRHYGQQQLEKLQQQEGVGLAGKLYQSLIDEAQRNRGILSGRVHELVEDVKQNLGGFGPISGCKEFVVNALREGGRGLIRSELEAAKEEIDRLQGIVEEAGETIGRQEAEIERLQGIVEEAGAKEEIDRLQGIVEEAGETIGRQEAEIERLQGIVEEAGETIGRQEAEIERLNQMVKVLNERLERERYSIVRPVLRRCYRGLMPLVLALPEPMRRFLAAAKRRLYPYPVGVLANGKGSPLPEGAVLPFESVSSLNVQASKGKKSDVILFPVIDWHFRIQRPQHLCRALAANGHRVFYLSTTFILNDEPGFAVTESPNKGIFICHLNCRAPHPNIYENILQGETLEFLNESLRRLVSTYDLGSMIALVDLPFWRPMALALRNTLVVYDCMDHHAGFSTNAAEMLKEEEKLLRQADLVITTARLLSQKISEKRDNILIRNGAEVGFFSRKPDRFAIEKDERPVIGYFGAISEWFDIDLLVHLAKAKPDWRFILVGSTYGCKIHKAKSIPNIEFKGEVPYADLPSWLYVFDVCMIPFRVTELTLCTNPVKVYEYLAAGKPVVGTDLPELREMDGMVRVAKDRAEFLVELEAALAETEDPKLLEGRREWAKQHDWLARARQLDEAIARCYPKVSVVVLTYNNLEFTRACLHSLENATCYPDWELVIVDNASTDGTVGFLQEYADTHEHVKLILNNSNLGFAGGNNRGLEVARGEYIVILNNDTYVTPGWLHGLVRHLQLDSSIGLIGPVTNNIGNEARIEIHYRDMRQMESAAYEYTSAHARKLLEVDTVAFFCVAMPRSLYSEIGGLDERFGQGFFEDDDYCQRARQAGYRVVIAEDVFVHHHLSASFGKLDDPERQKLFEKNKRLYEEKWGPWKPHRYRA